MAKKPTTEKKQNKMSKSRIVALVLLALLVVALAVSFIFNGVLINKSNKTDDVGVNDVVHDPCEVKFLYWDRKEPYELKSWKEFASVQVEFGAAIGEKLPQSVPYGDIED